MEATREKLVDDLRVLMDDAEELLRATAGQAGSAVGEVRQRVEQRLADTRRTLAEAEDLLIIKGREAAKSADDYVKENPWNAVGIAAGVGLVMGLLMRRR